jgi:hypothetical protein
VLKSARYWQNHLGPGTLGRLKGSQKQKYHLFVLSPIFCSLFRPLPLYSLTIYIPSFTFLYLQDNMSLSAPWRRVRGIDLWLHLFWIHIAYEFEYSTSRPGSSPQKDHRYPLCGTKSLFGWFTWEIEKKRLRTCRNSSTGPSSLVIIPTTPFRLLIYFSVCHCLLCSQLTIFTFFFLLLLFESFFNHYSLPLFLPCFFPFLSALSISSLYLFKMRRKMKENPTLRQDPYNLLRNDATNCVLLGLYYSPMSFTDISVLVVYSG